MMIVHLHWPRCYPIALAWLGLLLCGCVNFSQLSPGARPVVLNASEGLVVLQVVTDTPISHIHASGQTALEAIPPGKHIYFVRVTEGRYRWSKLEQRSGNWRTWYVLSADSDDFEFEVKSQHINYVGMLVVQSAGGRHLYIRTKNRASTLYAELERAHPELLNQFPFRYAGPGKDIFIERYLEARSARDAARKSGSRMP